MKNKFLGISMARINVVLNIILFFMVLLIIFVGFCLEKPRQVLKKEREYSRVVFKIEKENIENITQKKEDIAILPNNQSLEHHINDSDLKIINNPVVAIVIGNLGLSKFITEKFSEMPEFITLGYSAYAANLDFLLKDGTFKKHKHEVLINLPLEPHNYFANEFCPLTLFKELSTDEKLERLDSILNVIPTAVGVYVDQEENFTNSLEGSKFILESLNKRNKIILYGNNNKTILNQVANIYNYKKLDIDVRLDSVLSKSGIEQQLEKLEQIARDKGVAIAYSNAYPILADIIPEWSAQVEKRNITILPITAIRPIINNDSKKVIERKESEEK